MQAGSHERGHAGLDGIVVVGVAYAASQAVDPASARKREQQGAADEVIAPEDIGISAARQDFLKYANQPENEIIEMLRHQTGTPFRRVGDQ